VRAYRVPLHAASDVGSAFNQTQRKSARNASWAMRGGSFARGFLGVMTGSSCCGSRSPTGDGALAPAGRARTARAEQTPTIARRSGTRTGGRRKPYCGPPGRGGLQGLLRCGDRRARPPPSRAWTSWRGGRPGPRRSRSMCGWATCQATWSVRSRPSRWSVWPGATGVCPSGAGGPGAGHCGEREPAQESSRPMIRRRSPGHSSWGRRSRTIPSEPASFSVQAG
jgi:hypothetical protein